MLHRCILRDYASSGGRDGHFRTRRRIGHRTQVGLCDVRRRQLTVMTPVITFNVLLCNLTAVCQPPS